jgi:hypothetical protein
MPDQEQANHRHGWTVVSDSVLHAIDQLTDRVNRLEVSVTMISQALRAYAAVMDPPKPTGAEEVQP